MNSTDGSGGYGGGSQPGAGGYNLPPPQGGGYGPPPQAPGPFDKVKAFVATTPGKLAAGCGMLMFLGMCGTVCGAAMSNSTDANGVKVSEAAKNCRDNYDENTKYSNCAAACDEGAKWACDVAETLKVKLKEAAKTKADDAVAARERAAVSEVARARQPVAAVAAREPVADTKPAAPEPEPASLSGKRETFPGIVQKFIDMNELQQDAYAATFQGVVLSGSGEVSEVEKCGFLDDSKKWGDDCVKLVLDSGIPRVALYYGEKDKATVAARTKGSRVTFSNCVANSIKNWGFWSTATCDMP